MDTNNASIADALWGAAGGLAGLAALRLYWKIASALPGEDPRARLRKGAKKEMGERDVAAQQRQRRAEMAAAEEAPGDWDEEHAPLFPKTPPRYRVPWLYGPAMGAAYGFLFGPSSGRDLSGGLVFGAGVWLLGDELLLPLLGRHQGQAQTPLKQHTHRLGAHLVYGAATAAATQALYRLVQPPTRRQRAARTLKAAWKSLKGRLTFSK